MRRKKLKNKIKELLRENGEMSTHSLHNKMKEYNFNPSTYQVANICRTMPGIVKVNEFDYTVNLQMGKVRIRGATWRLTE